MLLFFLLLNMQKTVICISYRIHHCINIKDWWRSVGSFEYWRNLFYAVRRGGRVQCRAISDLLMLNPELNLHTHKFTCRVHGESPGELCNMLSTLRSLETHIFQSPDELLKAHHPHHVFLHRLELVVAPEYKDHVALEVRGANLFKFLFPHVVFLVTPPIFQFPSYESVAFPWYFTSTLKTLFKRIFPTYSAQSQFSCTCSSPHFPFLGKLLQSDFSVFLYWFFFLVEL